MTKARGLEVAPLNRATVTKTEGDLTYIDRLDYETLERYRNDPNLTSPILPVDVACWLRGSPRATGSSPKFDNDVQIDSAHNVRDFSWFTG